MVGVANLQIFTQVSEPIISQEKNLIGVVSDMDLMYHSFWYDFISSRKDSKKMVYINFIDAFVSETMIICMDECNVFKSHVKGKL